MDDWSGHALVVVVGEGVAVGVAQQVVESVADFAGVRRSAT